jgi:hypothetical protein
MERDIRQELEEAHRANAAASPVARMRAIKQRLARAANEAPANRLVATLGAVEALSRSLIVHAAGRPSSTAEMRYRQVRGAAAVELVEEVLRLYAAGEPAARFGADGWTAFALAQESRELFVHECVQLERELYAPLIAAAEAVLQALVEVGGLPRLVA